MACIHATEDQFERLMASIEAEKRASADEMPTEQDALKVMFQAYERLKELGWKEGRYAPKDGTIFDTISVGSTGVHDCNYSGEWPSGYWNFYDGGDCWPTRTAPALYRLKPPKAEA